MNRTVGQNEAHATPLQFYTRVEIHSGPDEKGRYFHSRFWMTDYKPGHPDGEYKVREVGQVFNAPLPDRALLQELEEAARSHGARV